MGSALFYGLSMEEIDSALKCLSAQRKRYRKSDLIYEMGKPIDRMGIVVEGMVTVEKTDFWGNRSILTMVEEGQVFGEVFAGLGIKAAETEVTAASDCEVLFLDVARILTRCSQDCKVHNQIIRNYVELLTQKNYQLRRKMEHLTQRTTRNKLMSYLSEQAAIHGSNKFRIPYDRQQLADYLCVERSAMSKELGKMRDEGLILFSKNQFEIIHRQPSEDGGL